MYQDIYRPQAPFREIGEYSISINGTIYSFSSLVSADGVIAWTPKNDQDRINPQYKDRDFKEPIRVEEATREDIARILAQLVLFKTKDVQSLGKILEKHEPLIDNMFRELKNTKMH